jgi:transposase-like protein
MNHGHGEKLSRKQEQAICALLTEATVESAARKAGISHSTLKRWLKDPVFCAAYRQARRELLETSIGRIQAATGTAVDTLLVVAQTGTREADRVRASIAILELAFRGLAEADTLHGGDKAADSSPMVTPDVVKVLSARLRQIDESELPTAEKSRLTASLADALLRAIATDVLGQRLEALQAVLMGRKDKP